MNVQKLHEKFSIIPIGKDKAPALPSWKPYQTRKIELSQLEGHDRFGIVCGFENLEVIDIDNHFDDADELFGFVYDNYDLSEFPVVKTQGGGYHIYYKCNKIEGNRKLAQRINQEDRPETLIETRGVGGYVVAPPTEKYEVISGDLLSVPFITPEERDDLLSVCKALNEVVREEKEKEKEEIKIEKGSPLDQYHSDIASVEETKRLLKNQGWKELKDGYWRRPGKKEGVSATFGRRGVNKFYVFSTNAHPFESDKSYSMVGVRATLLHNGNFSDCAKELAEKYNITPSKIKDASENKKKAKNVNWKILFEIIKDWGLKFRYNELTNVVEYTNGLGWQNPKLLYGDIVYEMEAKRGVNKIGRSKVEEMIMNRTICKIYNPIKEFIDDLPKWDGKDYFEKICNYIIIDVDEDKSFFYNMIKKHIIRALRCATSDYVNRMVLTFYGPQEKGKTRFFQWLVPDEVYNQELLDPNDKDSTLALSRYLILNMDDIDSLNRREVAKLKGFISKGSITKRLPYGRTDEKFNRIASFVSSTNKSDILSDDSNTRWIILKVLDFDWKKYTKEVDPRMLWAQAKALLKKDIESGELTKEERDLRDSRNNQNFLETTQEREILMKYFEEGTEMLTRTDILCMMTEQFPRLKINEYVLGKELKRIFGEPERRRNDGILGRYYFLKHHLSTNAGAVVNHYEVDKDLPF